MMRLQRFVLEGGAGWLGVLHLRSVSHYAAEPGVLEALPDWSLQLALVVVDRLG